MKTFKSAVSSGHLDISDAKRGLINVSIMRNTTILEMIDLSTETAPALALAILEAAGGRGALGIDVGNAMIDLRESIAEQERATAEAKEQAELEAEALVLYNASRTHNGTGNALTSWGQVIEKTRWLAVARKARELNGAGE